ncbi:MAG TPA: DUF4105 domain-containing protein [Kiritimatiellia bacterium]|nr:DUF4105 domain-containing protein [Kiritimatiellia bacterium]HMO97888.1 DUF4105 domain-containing protein [Kiritimatiellia bacterium]HMP95592.1 DUF4105 domain-containing protein [Kiritimatiellia bacterium]
MRYSHSGCKPGDRFASFLCAGLFGLFASWASADFEPIPDPYLETLLTEARALRLHEDPTWRLLGHYRPRWVGGWKSMIDDPAFFNAPNGKYDPEAELAATLAVFFQPAPDDPEERHPVCRFPARLAWLKEVLAIDPERLPVPTCDIFEQVYGYLRPTTLTLVFPAAYMNSPASMFGHTLLVFDSADKNRLLAKGVGYAAAVTTGFGPLFALQGIMGMYPGRYAIEDYFDKVEQYNDIHRRDIWEYELDLTQEEVDRVFRHTWELQNVWSWYYFFDENCAYKLYQLIDVARPDLRLSDDTSWLVIPIDTVKLINERGLVRQASFRPSKATRLNYFAASLPPERRRKALEVARGRESPEAIARDDDMPAAERRLALDFAADYAQYLFTERLVDRPTYSERFIAILRERSRLGPREENEVRVTWPARPEEGHAASALAPGVGWEQGDFFLSLRGRVAYHGLLDNDTGFTRGAQIMFLNSEARWRTDLERLEWRFIDVVHVESIAPRTELFTPTAWRARLGFTQMDRRRNQNGMVFSAQTGGGAAWEIGERHLVWGMLESEIHLGDRYRSWIAGGPGASANWMITLGRDWKSLLQARTAWIYEGDDDWWRVETSAGVDRRLTREQSLRLLQQYTRNHDLDMHETTLSWNLFF